MKTGARAPRRVRIVSGDLSLTATLADNRAARALWKMLPVEGKASTWGQEIYFSIPLELGPSKEDRDVVEMGDLAYWGPGSAICLFFGATPASRGQEIRAASPVTVLGRIAQDPTVLNAVEDGHLIRIERLKG